MALYDPARLRTALEATGAAALVATSPQNILHLTRFRKAGGALAVVTVRDPARPTLLVPAANIDFVLEDPDPAVEVVPYGTFYRAFAGPDLAERDATVRRLHQRTRHGVGLAQAATEVLADVGGPVVADAPVEVVPGLRDALPGLAVTADSQLFLRLRMVKTAEELARLRTAAAITEEAIAESTTAIAPGATQADLAAAYNAAVVTRGAAIRADNVSIDAGAALGNVNMPTDRVRADSVVRYDLGVIYRGYASDIARCFCLAAPTQRTATEYAALWQGQQAALDRLAPGVTAGELFETAVAEVRRHGLPGYERTHVGHGIGIAGGYDKPLLAADDDTVIEAGMVLCVETPYYEVGRIGLQVEDMVVVTEDSYEPLSRSSRDLVVLG